MVVLRRNRRRGHPLKRKQIGLVELDRLKRVNGNEPADGVQLVGWKVDYIAEFDVRSRLPLRQQSVQAVVHVPERYPDNVGNAELVPPYKSIVYRVSKAQSPGKVGYRPLDQTGSSDIRWG